VQPNPVLPNGGDSSPNGSGQGGSGSAGSGSGAGTTGTATAAQQVGVVDINTVLDFGAGKAAGTGIVLTSSGEILTNNHVIQGSTSITVVVVSTGKQYTATVVGTDPTDDVAVLQLSNASGLQTAKLGNSGTVAVGNPVTAVGNAGGVGGTPSAATGTVTALNQSITASDTNGSNQEQLTGMIQIAANIQAGDSGGPLYAADGTVIGVDTAANASRGYAGTTGFAIPIAKATSIASLIVSGPETSTIHLGYPAFLGVQLSQAQSTTGGAVIGGVVSGSAAASAGLKAGDTVTSVNGTAVSSATALSQAMQKLQPGQQVRVGWVDAAGASHSATVTLGTGPAD
jgi:S1-C subfamily serine protease